jgi:hypothetical protein
MCFMKSIDVDESAILDLQNASTHFKQMPYSHRQALSEHGESVLLVAGVMAELNRREAYEHLLIATSSVTIVAENVRTHIKTVGENFLHDLQKLKASYPTVKLNSSQLGRQVLEIQNRADQDLIRKIGETFRSHLPASRFETKALKSFARGRGVMPGQVTEALSNTEKWIGRLKNVGTIVVALDLLGSVSDCVKDLKDGADDLKKCDESLGGFVGGASAGAVGGALIGTLSLVGAPLIGGAILVAGLTWSGSIFGKGLARDLYELVN